MFHRRGEEALRRCLLYLRFLRLFAVELHIAYDLLLPLAVSDGARAGDADAVEQVLLYYEGYINKLCTRTVYDESGGPHARLDEHMKSRL